MRASVEAGPTADTFTPDKSKSSPFFVAVAICLGTFAGAILSMGGTVGIDDLLNGSWLSRPSLAEAQRKQEEQIAALTKRLNTVATDTEYLDVRIDTVARRAETAHADQLALVNGEIAVLQGKIGDVEALRSQVNSLQLVKPRPMTISESLISRVDGFETGMFDVKNGVSALRSSVHDLAVSHRGEIAALTQRLDKIETLITADVTSSIPRTPANTTAPATQKRSNLKQVPTVAPRQRSTEAKPKLPLQIVGHIVDVREQAQPEAPVVPIRSSYAPERD